MQQKSKIIENDYKSAFILDDKKLSKIENMLSERFKDHQLELNTIYTIYLSDDRKIVLNSRKEVLDLDNTIRNPIRSLNLFAANSSDQHNLSASITFSNRETDNIHISVSSDDPNFVSRLFAELEEQVQRTFLNNWIYKLKRR